jgi:eukaryotic-like serine/threonine-protein kinase
MLPVFSAALSIMFISLVPLSPILAFSTSSENNNLQKTTTIATTILKEQSNNLTPYINPLNGFKMKYPTDWKLVEHGDNDYHKLNIIGEFLQPNQSNYYDPSISASHNSLRISVENYSAFADKQDINTTTGNELQNIGNHRLGAIGISCPGFDLKSYVRNATLAGSPAYEIKFDYSYIDNNKKAVEIWTVKDNKVYIIDYVAYGQVYDITVPVVQKMIQSFEIT